MRTRTLVIVALLAFAVGGTCPSDVNNDGTVGINDFLQVLGDWGPCPTPPRVVGSDTTNASGNATLVARLWSDNHVQLAIDPLNKGLGCWFCEDSTPVDQWIEVDPPSLPAGASPIAVSVQAIAGDYWLYVLYSDGTTYVRIFDGLATNSEKCGGLTLCVIGDPTPWELFAQP